MTLSQFEGKTVVVTGGAQGIGKEISCQFLQSGASVAILDADQVQLEKSLFDLQAEFSKSKLIGIVCDITKEEEVKSAFNLIKKELDSVSILVNNAGIIKFLSLEDTTIEDWDKMMAVNLRGAFLCVKEVISDMKENGWGKIVNIGSSAGVNGGARNVGAYAASKAGIMCLTKSLANELAPFHINVNGVAPALIDTRMFEGISDLANKIPLGRSGTTGDVANAVVFLCKEESSYITGEIMNVNGGFLID
jgi:3-oxoacyl-[acyl-carrier protein] reductase